PSMDRLTSLFSIAISSSMPAHIEDKYDEGRDSEGIIREVSTIFPLPPELNASVLSSLKPKQIEEKLFEQAEALYEQREKEIGSENMRMLERLIMLRIIDSLWTEHLTLMEDMRLDAGWQTLRQVKAVDAYKNKGYEQFQVLLSTIQHDVAHTIFHVGLTQQTAPRRAPVMAQVAGGQAGDAQKQPVRVWHKKVGRNEPCPCGSGKKYKHCCGR
ncbi:SEC-C metal-binding domain-containing protein, partial [Chloroflexota bacterium]